MRGARQAMLLMLISSIEPHSFRKLGDVLSLYNVFFLAAKGPAVVEHKVDTKVARPCMTMHGKNTQIPLAINPYWF